MAALGAIATLVSAGIGAMGAIQQGKAQQAALNYEAKMREKQAAEERAASQREAIAKREEAETVMSRQKALAGASGAGVTTPSILDIYSDTAARGEYGAQGSLYGGESRARGQLDLAKAARFKGQAAYKGSIFDAAGGLIGGVSKAFG